MGTFFNTTVREPTPFGQMMYNNTLFSPISGWGTVPVTEQSSSSKGEQVSTLHLGCFLCVALSAFLGDASRGLVVPFISHSFTRFCDKASWLLHTLMMCFFWRQGLIVASLVGWMVYSAGRLAAAPLFGYWAEKRGFREAMFINLILFIIGKKGQE